MRARAARETLGVNGDGVATVRERERERERAERLGEVLGECGVAW